MRRHVRSTLNTVAAAHHHFACPHPTKKKSALYNPDKWVCVRVCVELVWGQGKAKATSKKKKKSLHIVPQCGKTV